jgi:hypothetical protein
MRVGVIRGDVPSPIFVSDLEPTSQFNPPTEPFGQTRYISRPNPTYLTNFLAGVYYSDTEDGTPSTLLPIPSGKTGYGGVPAGIQSSAAVTFPVVVAGGSNTLLVKNLSSAGYTTATVASASYATMSALLVAINTALAVSKLVTATTDTATGTLVVLQSTIPGVGSFIEIGAGTLNGSLNLSTSQTFTMPTAATIITDMNPVVVPPATGSINVSAANILTVLGASPAAANVVNLIAPQFQETEVAIQSYQHGNLAGYLLPTWNPNSRLLPPITSGPAIQVVQNDGVTSFASSASAPLPMITAAVHNSPNTGDITITGVGLGNVESFDSTQVTITGVAGTAGVQAPYVKLTQAQIVNVVSDGVALTGTFDVTEGSDVVIASLSQAGLLVPGNSIVFAEQPDTVYYVSSVATVTITLDTEYTGVSNAFSTATTPKTKGVVTNTSIVIPAVLLKSTTGVALGVAGSTVMVKYDTFANSNYGAAAIVSAPVNGIVTVTGLTGQVPAMVGKYLTLSGAVWAGNNGTFQITGYVSATSVLISNFNGVAVSGLSWSEPAPVPFIVT